jgi:acetyl esterase/lipase
MELQTKKLKVVGGFSNADIDYFYWVNDDRLVFTTHDRGLADGENEYFPGLYAVNRDGSEFRTLIDRVWSQTSTTGTIIKKRIISADNYFYSLDPKEGTDSVFIVEPIRDIEYSAEAFNLLKLNTKTGLTERFNRPGKTVDWLIDQNGIPRINITSENGLGKIFYLDDSQGKWTQLAEFNSVSGNVFTPYEFGLDGFFYVLSRKNNKNSGLYRFDLKNKRIEDNPIISIKGFDFSGELIFDRHKKQLLGVRFLNDAASTLWLDDELKAIQKKVDDLLPGTINQISLGQNGVTPILVVRSYSDVQPSVYFLFDTQTQKLEILGSSFPSIDALQMASQDFFKYKARDGLDIPAYISIPKQSTGKNLPMVVLVHGGPYVRGASWGWDPEVQFLASRGYAVLQPEFRGSTGFGYAHFKAGWKQWGLAMQDDIADGVKWAIQQGIADPKRVCIAGASYGGYATLMGLARNPELFKCGVNWVGVTDISLLYQFSWSSDSSKEWRQYGLPILVGDKVKDAEKIAANSPVNNVHLITQPVLLAYGEKDRRVPIKHGEIFLNAIKKTNNHVEWIEYPEEGHGWSLVKNRVDFWNKVDVFLEKNLLEQQ